MAAALTEGHTMNTETLLSSPSRYDLVDTALEPLLTHGVTERHSVASAEDAAIEELGRDGFTMIRSALTQAAVGRAAAGMDALYARQVEEFGAENIKRIRDKYIVRTMLAYDDFFLHDIACNAPLLGLIRRVLGQNISLSSQVGILSPPDDLLYQVAWHRELQYQHFTSSRPIALQTLLCVDRFDALTGATFFLPGSHLHETFSSDGYALRHETQIIAEPGDAIVFNALTYHRAGVNRSGRVRRAINNLYTLPIIQQQINMSRMMNGRYRDDPFLAGLLGYRWETADSVLAWRTEHLRRQS
jgi:ectoine hydroxylase-related dioxygenase (phytanoyl-CoA dioxygenase family)